MNAKYLNTKELLIGEIMIKRKLLNAFKFKSVSLIVVLFGCVAFVNTAAASDKPHHLGLFVGVLDDDEKDTAIGIEYEYKFDSGWGVGAIYEKAKNAHHGDGVTSKILAGYYHPGAGWRLGIGYGSEKVGGHHSEDLVRYGVAYEFHVGGVGVEPSFNVDTVDGHSFNVYGVAFVWAF